MKIGAKRWILFLIVLLMICGVSRTLSSYIPEYQRPKGKLLFSAWPKGAKGFEIEFLVVSKNINNKINKDKSISYLKIDQYKDLFCSSAFQKQILATGVKRDGTTDVLLIYGDRYQVLYSTKEEIESPKMAKENELFFCQWEDTREKERECSLIKFHLKEKMSEVIDGHIKGFYGYTVFSNGEILYAKELEKASTIFRVDSAGKSSEICKGENPCAMKDGQSFIFENESNLIMNKNGKDTIIKKNVDAIRNSISLSPDEAYVTYGEVNDIDNIEVAQKIVSVKYGWTVKALEGIEKGDSFVWIEE